MSRKPTLSVFLQRASYRQRRLRDAARLVPFLGIVLLAIPLTWPAGDTQEPIGSAGLLYIFGVWALLIILTAVLSSFMRADASLSAKDVTEE